ncbi:uncharacterized protein LOC9661746 isoform X1 [Selaginella moellendorffii]|uniref:uncharacterized protein LOC9661746 isoform X1 n=1 Tax=Selaginella moellendorffii TaxID=88036 RepID=UPI000D1CAB6E|nr:uncharacterized protein LOC9661746 isoform X1 [Selaginella moellendorffii]|eukprot:XP_024521831.1 uncharacterized protein LOC9661746 isoform X1 [Selaginella moellendorffii]
MALRIQGWNPAAHFPVKSHLARFQRSKKLFLPCEKREKSPQEYLKQVDRVIRITFQEPARAQHIEGSLWRARLITVSVFSMSATPVCDFKVDFDEALQLLKIQSQQLYVKLHGGPDLDINFSLQGELRVVKQRQRYGALLPRTDEGEEPHSFEGFLTLALAIDLPSILPHQAVKLAGDVAMETILASLERDLSKGIVQDYNSWCHEEDDVIRKL